MAGEFVSWTWATIKVASIESIAQYQESDLSRTKASVLSYLWAYDDVAFVTYQLHMTTQ